VDLSTGTNYGSVIAWKMGLPPAWKHRLHQDASQRFAGNLQQAFGALYLAEDPRTTKQRYFGGQALLEYLDERRAKHNFPQALSDRLIDYFAGACLEWRSFLEDGTLRQHPVRLQIAIEHAVVNNDSTTAQALAALGEAFDRPLRGAALPIDVALSSGAFAAALVLVELGAPVGPHCLLEAKGALPLRLAKLLVTRGAMPSGEAAVHLVAHGATEAAAFIGQAIPGMDLTLCRVLVNDAKQAALVKLKRSLVEVQAGRLAHYLGGDGLQDRILRIPRSTSSASILLN
jgi:hypothetical protein